MKVNNVNGTVRCPYCGESHPTINYNCNTSGNEWGYIDEDGDESMTDSETNDSYDYEYEMDCCNHSVDYDDIKSIYKGEFEVDREIEGSYEWEDDEEEELEDIDPRQLLLNKIICLK